MYNYKITIAFAGTAYCGWQVQSNGRSVCQTFQDAVEKTLGARYDVKGCSRTDSGVHARNFVLSLRCDMPVPPEGLKKGLNSVLPEDISVLVCETAAEGFHPRYDCVGKRYVYRIFNSDTPDPFLAPFSWRVRRALDEKAMAEAAAGFTGRHDFSAFCSAGGSIPEGKRERTITEAAVERQGKEILFSVTGDGFLYNMVRIMAGTLAETGAGKRRPGELADIVASLDRSRAGVLAPARGLYLDRVFYPEET